MAPGELVQVQPPWEEAVVVVQPPTGYTGAEASAFLQPGRQGPL